MAFDVNAFLRRPAVIAAAAVMSLRGLTLVSRFVLSVLLARMIPVPEMGNYGLLTAVLAFALLVLGLEFYSYTLRELVPASPAKRVQIIADQMLLAAIAYLVITAFVIAAVFLGLFPAEMAPWFLLILGTEHLSLEATRFLIITSRPVRAYLCVFFRGGIWVYVIVVLMVRTESSRSLETVLTWWALGGVASVVVAAMSLSNLPWRNLRRYRPNWIWLRAGLRTARPFMLTSVSALTLSYFDRFTIDTLLGREALGIYSFYSVISIGILSLGASISQQFLPKVISAYAEGPAAFVAVLRSFSWSLLAIAVGTVGIAALAIWPLLIFTKLAGYASYVAVFYLMLPGALLRILADVPSYALYAARADNQLFACNLGAAGLSILLNLGLVPIIGLYGAALANSVASGFLLLILSLLAVRKIRDPFRKTPPPTAFGNPTDADILYP